MSASAFFFSASSTNTHCQPWVLDPVGACSANSRHSISTSRGTGFSKSSLLRTERVVVRTSSAERLSVMTGDYIRRHGNRIHARGFRPAYRRSFGVVDHGGQIRPAGSKAGVVLLRRQGRVRLLRTRCREGPPRQEPSA